MADEAQLARLKQGVETWNNWRQKFASDLDLSRAKLSGANLSGANLSEVNLRGANLRGANLSDADLSKANLSEADLTLANLSLVDLRGANLSLVDLRGANLSRTSLSGADLSDVNLSGVNLSDVNLSNVNLNRLNLSGANLSDVNLNGLNLSGANLSGSSLERAQALGTNFTKTILTEACIEDWNINAATKLDGVVCKCIYLKQGKKERRPSDPSQTFAPGEFTKLFQKAQETLDLIFRNGVDWQALLISLEKLKVEAEGAELSIQAIENKNDGAFVVRVNVPPEANKGDVEKFLRQEYDLQLKVIDERYQGQLHVKDVEIESYRRENTNLMRIAEWATTRPITVQATATAESKAMAENQPKNVEVEMNISGGTGIAGKVVGNQNVYAAETKQNLAEAAKEIQDLLYQLSLTNPTSTDVVSAVHQEIRRNPTLKARLISALKAGGLEALKAIFNHPLFSIPAETVKGWLEAEQC